MFLATQSLFDHELTNFHDVFRHSLTTISSVDSLKFIGYIDIVCDCMYIHYSTVYTYI